MKLIKRSVSSMVLVLAVFFIFLGNAQALNTAWPVSSELYQFPGQTDEDWKITFNLYTNYTPDPNNFRVYILSNYGGYWADMTDHGQFCRADLVSTIYMGWGYQVVYILGKNRAVVCFGQVSVETWEVYMTYP